MKLIAVLTIAFVILLVVYLLLNGQQPVPVPVTNVVHSGIGTALCTPSSVCS